MKVMLGVECDEELRVEVRLFFLGWRRASYNLFDYPVCLSFHFIIFIVSPDCLPLLSTLLFYLFRFFLRLTGFVDFVTGRGIVKATSALKKHKQTRRV